MQVLDIIHCYILYILEQFIKYLLDIIETMTEYIDLTRLEQLNDAELFQLVADFPILTLLALCRTSRRFQVICQDETLWRRRIRTDFGIVIPEGTPLPSWPWPTPTKNIYNLPKPDLSPLMNIEITITSYFQLYRFLNLIAQKIQTGKFPSVIEEQYQLFLID